MGTFTARADAFVPKQSSESKKHTQFDANKHVARNGWGSSMPSGFSSAVNTVGKGDGARKGDMLCSQYAEIFRSNVL